MICPKKVFYNLSAWSEKGTVLVENLNLLSRFFAAFRICDIIKYQTLDIEFLVI